MTLEPQTDLRRASGSTSGTSIVGPLVEGNHVARWKAAGGRVFSLLELHTVALILKLRLRIALLTAVELLSAALVVE